MLRRALRQALSAGVSAIGLLNAEQDAERWRALAERLDHPPGISPAYDQAAEGALQDPATPMEERIIGRWAGAAVCVQTMVWEWRHQRHGWGLPRTDRSATAEPWSQPIVVSPTLPYAMAAPPSADDPADAARALIRSVSPAQMGMTPDAGTGPGGGGSLISRRISAAGEPFVLVNLAMSGAALMEVAWSRSCDAAVAPHVDGLMRSAMTRMSPWRGATGPVLSTERQALDVLRRDRFAAAQDPWLRFWQQWNSIFGITVPTITWYRQLAALEVPLLIDAACADITSATHATGARPPPTSRSDGWDMPSRQAGPCPLGADNGPAQVRQIQEMLRLGGSGPLVPYQAMAAPDTKALWRAVARLLVIERLLVQGGAIDGVDAAGAPASAIPAMLAAAYGPLGSVSTAVHAALASVHGMIVQEVLGGSVATTTRSPQELLPLLRAISSGAGPVRSALLASLDHGDPAVNPGHDGFERVCAEIAQAIGLGTQAMAVLATAAGEAAEGACADAMAWVEPLVGERPDGERRIRVQQTLRALRLGLAAVLCDPPLLGQRHAQAVPGVDIPETRVTDLVPSEDPEVDFWVHACIVSLFPKLRAQDHQLFLGSLAQEWARTEAATLLLADGVVDGLLEASSAAGALP